MMSPLQQALADLYEAARSPKKDDRIRYADKVREYLLLQHKAIEQLAVIPRTIIKLEAAPDTLTKIYDA